MEIFFPARLFSFPRSPKLLKKACFLTVILFLFIALSCAAPSPKPTAIPEETGYFPRKVYSLDFHAAWETTLRGLREKNIPVAFQNKEMGIIRTEYQPGPDTPLLESIYASRYKYNIFLFRGEEKKTILNIRCVYEVKEKERERGNYTDVSSSYPDKTIPFEKELYQTLESYLLPREASRERIQKNEKMEPITPAQPPAYSPPIAVAPVGAPESKEAPSAAPAPTLPVPVPSVSTEKAGPSPKEPPPPATSFPKTKPAQQSKAKEIFPAQPKAESKGKMPGDRKIYLVTINNANLREGPSPQTKLIVTLRKGRKVEKIGESGSWVKVKIWEKTIGWVQKNLLKEIP